jgi:DNA-binding GntR family transcriptional regulator
MIEDQNLQAGSRLPTSIELVELSGFSLISVRRALDELERAGRVERQQGVGTFVARKRIVSDPARTGDLLDTLAAGRDDVDFKTKLVSIKIGMPSPIIASSLRVAEGSPVWEIVRLRLLDGEPVIAETAVLPLQLVPTLDEDWLANGKSLYGFLAEHYGLVDDHEEQYLEVTMPTPAERTQLALSAREQVVRIRGVSVTDNGTPFDCFQQIYQSRQFVFFVSGTHDRRLLPAMENNRWGVTPLPG